MDVDRVSAIVTGGASGLGEAACRSLAAAGATVFVADIQRERGERLARDLGGTFVRTDVTSTEDIINAVDLAAAAAPLRVLVTCAGTGSPHRTIGADGDYATAHDLASYRRILDINLVGTFDMIRIAASAMSRTTPDEDGQRGAIVTTSSIAATEGQIGQSSYTSTKAAILGMTLPIARDLAAAGIRVNSVLPGCFDTPAWGELDDADDLRRQFGKDILFPKRFGRPDEFAALVMHLLANNYINAEAIRIDGGARMPPHSGLG